MNDAVLLSTLVAQRNAESDYCADSCKVNTLPFVGQDADRMTDEQREAAIYRAGIAMAAWYSHWKQSGKPEYIDVAYHFLGLQKQLLAGRSAEYVAKLEQERGLA